MKRTLVFDDGTLQMEPDGSCSLIIPDEQFVLEDDRSEGPDGPQGSLHWTARFSLSEVKAIQQFLATSSTPPTDAELKEMFDSLDFSFMETADDLFYMIARETLSRFGNRP